MGIKSSKEIKIWYDNMYKKYGKNIGRPYSAYPHLVEYLGHNQKGKLLEVGCGRGYFLKAANEKGLETYGVDISEEAVILSKSISLASKVQVVNGEKLPFPNNYFDYVCSLGALEHFLDVNRGLIEMKRVANDNALFLITVPNKKFIFWKFKNKYGTMQSAINEHLFSLYKWKEIISDAGLKVEKVIPDRWYTKYPPSFKLRRFIHKLAWRILPLDYTYQLVFILRKEGSL